MTSKRDAEFGYWKKCFEKEGEKLHNSWYEKLMMNISGKEETWFEDKVICDFGCGPRGSLEWMDIAGKRICADVLVDDYMEIGIAKHKALYIRTTEDQIPLPSGYCDVVFTINSLDHVEKIDDMCQELLRITRPGGYVGGSINLNEPPTPAEPQTITLKLFETLLASKLIIERKLQAPKYEGDGGVYKHLVDHCETGKPMPELGDKIGYLWFLGRKPEAHN